MALTSKVCLRLLTLNATGEAQDVNGRASNLHSKVEPGSLAMNSNLARLRFVLSFGPLMIVVSGAGAVGPAAVAPGQEVPIEAASSQ